jgi:hypothetical protein
MRTWVTWHELTNTPRGTVEELRAELCKYSRSSVLKACSRLSVVFGYGPDGETAADLRVTARWIPTLFPAGLVPLLLAFAQQERVIFFQAQLRYLAAEVIRLGPSQGEDLPVVANNALGELLLRAGELLYFEHEKPTDPTDAMANLIVQFLPIYEIDSPTDPSMLLLRSYILLTVNIPRMSDKLRTFDVPALFEGQFGFPLKTYCEFLLCLFMHAMMQRDKKTVTAAMESEVKISTFQNTSVPSDMLTEMFETVSFSLDTLSGLEDPVGYADFEFVRTHPYFRHEEALYCLDYEFAAGKLESGVLWRILRNLDEAKREPYLSFWGNVFEDYVTWLFETYACKDKNAFYASPRYENRDALPICDAIIVCDDTAILVEAKLATCPIKVRYSGDYKKMRKFLEDRLVTGTNRAVGVAQLLKAIDNITTLPQAELPKWLRGIRKFIPLIITKDDIGSSWVVTRYLNTRFKEQLKRKKRHTITPLAAMSVATLERAMYAVRTMAFSEIVEDRLREDKELGRPFEAASSWVPRGTARMVTAHLEILNKLTEEMVKDFELRDPDVVAATLMPGQRST